LTKLNLLALAGYKSNLLTILAHCFAHPVLRYEIVV